MVRQDADSPRAAAAEKSGAAPDLGFYRGKRVLVTGHTGFKGSWLCRILVRAGADVTGYALTPPTSPSLFDLCGAGDQIASVIGDVRDPEHLLRIFQETRPQIVFHLAAQPIVRESYKNPVLTYETNVMGTVHVLECVRRTPGVRSVLNVTTDKVYQNMEWEWGYRETDVLNGYDPYSNSKSCSELVTSAYKKSFFTDGATAVSTARAGNVIGGGDFAPDRIIPDCVRAAEKKMPIVIRNPYSTRPFQHVLDPLSAYLLIAERQVLDPSAAGSYNVGPKDEDCISAGALADLFVRAWGDGLTWEPVALEKRSEQGPHEANFLKLDCSKMKRQFGWSPRWDIRTAVEKTVEWSKIYLARESVIACMDRQIDEFFTKEQDGNV